jgi:2,4-dienoyl-CoA reductase-like NADH-dependent reductase (Old Yellow Enzyme family)
VTEYNNLYSPGAIGAKRASNRFVSQAMEANDGENGGKVSELGFQRYRKLASGGWGIIVVEALSVTEKSLARKNGMILTKENLDSFKRLTEVIKKENPETVVLFQVTHSGSKSNPAFSEPVSVCPDSGDDSRVLTTDEIQIIQDQFVESTILAEKAGADGVDFKMCHGYFGAEILRPSNTREDKWGGSFENRTRFLREGISRIRENLTDKYFILGSRISMYEALRGSCGTAGPEDIVEDLTEQMKLLQVMNALNMDYVNISAGVPGKTSEVTRPLKGSKYLYLNHFRYARTAKQFLDQLQSPMRVIGSAYSILKEEALVLGDENISKGYTDFAGWGRQSFADPLMPVKVANGEPVNWCIACSGCSNLMIAQEHDGCIVHNPFYKQLRIEVAKRKKGK